MPEQKMLSGAVWDEKAWVVGFHTYVGSGCCQPSNARTFPFASWKRCTATNGQLIRGVHSPSGAVAGVTGFDSAETGPSPTALVALTVNVYVVPFARPLTVVLLAGGVPVTFIGACAVPPAYGVIV
jgi:hypothetical protein